MRSCENGLSDNRERVIIRRSYLDTVRSESLPAAINYLFWIESKGNRKGSQTTSQHHTAQFDRMRVYEYSRGKHGLMIAFWRKKDSFPLDCRRPHIRPIARGYGATARWSRLQVYKMLYLKSRLPTKSKTISFPHGLSEIYDLMPLHLHRSHCNFHRFTGRLVLEDVSHLFAIWNFGSCTCVSLSFFLIERLRLCCSWCLKFWISIKIPLRTLRY